MDARGFLRALAALALTVAGACGEEEGDGRSADRPEPFAGEEALSIVTDRPPPRSQPEPPAPEPAPAAQGLVRPSVQTVDFGSRIVDPERHADGDLEPIVRRVSLLYEAGEAPVAIRDVFLDRVDLFDADGCRGETLSPEAPRCTITLRFRPAAAQVGASRGTMTVLTEHRSFTVRLAGAVNHLVAAAPPPPPPPVDQGPSAAETLRLARVSAPRAEVVRRRTAEPPPPDPLDRFTMSDPDYEEKLGQRRLDFTYPVDQSRMISKFRDITALVETPINSQLEGKFILTVARNVYGGLQGGERNVLLPAGSKMIGYNGRLQQAGDTRLPAIITDIERPDGSRIVIDAAAHDQMGRPGLIGTIDNRIWERFGTVGIVAVLNAAFAFAAGGGDDPRLQAAQEELSDGLAEIGNKVLEENIDLTPRMTVPGGARIQISIAEDLWFPEAQRIVVGSPDILVSSEGDGS